MKDERETGRWDADDVVKFMYGTQRGALLLALRDFWKALRSAWPDKKKTFVSPHRGDEPRE
ncbi:hypothetical protein AMC83_CH00977 [Rhizobium phaseoli]|nr:hypothetical protein AMC83_CH00977 [Rhizobium phaseoli]